MHELIGLSALKHRGAMRLSAFIVVLGLLGCGAKEDGPPTVAEAQAAPTPTKLQEPVRPEAPRAESDLAESGTATVSAPFVPDMPLRQIEGKCRDWDAQHDHDRVARIAGFVTPAERAFMRRMMICFKDVPASMFTPGILILDAPDGDQDIAARIPHLLHHDENQAVFANLAMGDNCQERVRNAMLEEGRAYLREVEARRRLSLQARYEFEGEGVTAEAITAYLEAHPDGAPFIEGLRVAYEQRCAGGSPPT